MVVLDTNVLIYYTRDELSVVQEVERWVKTQELILIPAVVEAELFAWPHLEQQGIAELSLSLAMLPLVSVPLNSTIARIGARISRQYRAHLIDALIAATAYSHQARLITRNTNDFKTKILL